MANTLWNSADKNAAITLSGSNLIATSSGANGWVRAVDKQISGKFYWEITATTCVNNSTGFGISTSSTDFSTGVFNSGIKKCAIVRVGTIVVDGVNAVTGFGTISSGTLICFACDVSSRLIWIRLGAAGNWNNSATANPATGAGGVNTNLGLGIPVYPTYLGNQASEVATANFGDTAFTGAVPSGFTAGFTAGASIGTNALATQVAAEEWITTNPPAQVTQVAIEEWGSVASGTSGVGTGTASVVAVATGRGRADIITAGSAVSTATADGTAIADVHSIANSLSTSIAVGASGISISGVGLITTFADALSIGRSDVAVVGNSASLGLALAYGLGRTPSGISLAPGRILVTNDPTRILASTELSRTLNSSRVLTSAKNGRMLSST